MGYTRAHDESGGAHIERCINRRSFVDQHLIDHTPALAAQYH